MSLKREEVLKSLLEESLGKIEHILATPSDELWVGNINDFVVSANIYLKSGELTDGIYNHKVLREKVK